MGIPSIRCGSVSVHSIRVKGKLENLQAVVKRMRIDILFMQETFHQPTDAVIRKIRKTPGCSIIEQARPFELGRPKHGGGLAILSLKSNVTVRKICYIEFHTTQFEYIVGHVECRPHKRSYMVVVIYRPGGSDIEPEFFRDLGNLLRRVYKRGRDIVLAGDIKVTINALS